MAILGPLDQGLTSTQESITLKCLCTHLNHFNHSKHFISEFRLHLTMIFRLNCSVPIILGHTSKKEIHKCYYFHIITSKKHQKAYAQLLTAKSKNPLKQRGWLKERQQARLESCTPMDLVKERFQSKRVQEATRKTPKIKFTKGGGDPIKPLFLPVWGSVKE